MTDWSALYAQCIKTDPETFKAYMDDFLDHDVPGFAVAETEEKVATSWR